MKYIVSVFLNPKESIIARRTRTVRRGPEAPATIRKVVVALLLWRAQQSREPVILIDIYHQRVCSLTMAATCHLPAPTFRCMRKSLSGRIRVNPVRCQDPLLAGTDEGGHESYIVS